jgi:hypothetical protein
MSGLYPLLDARQVEVYKSVKAKFLIHRGTKVVMDFRSFKMSLSSSMFIRRNCFNTSRAANSELISLWMRRGGVND